MAITFLDAGTADTFGLHSWSAVGGFGEATEATIVPWTGARSLKLPNYGSVTKNSVHQDSGTRLSFYFYASALPAASVTFCEVRSTVTGLQMRLALRSTGTLRLTDGASATHDGTAVLSAATWYRISLAYTVTDATTNEFRCFVDGTIDVTLSNISTNVTSGTPQLQFFQSGGGGGVINYVSSVYVDDSSALTDPGDVRITAKLPTSTNANNFDTTGGTGAVNQRPLSETDYKQHAAISTVSQNYAIETAAGGDVDVSGMALVGYGGWIWAKGTAGGAGTPKITVNGSDTAIVLTSAPAYYAAYTTSASYPTNAATVGMVSTNNADDTFLYETGMLIAYRPTAAVSATPAVGSEVLTGSTPGRVFGTLLTPVTP